MFSEDYKNDSDWLFLRTLFVRFKPCYAFESCRYMADKHEALCPQSVRFRPLIKLSRSPWCRPQLAKLTAQFWANLSWILLMISMAWNHGSFQPNRIMPFFLQVQTVEKVVEVPMVGQTSQGTTREVDIPLAPRREVGSGEMLQHVVLLSWFFVFFCVLKFCCLEPSMLAFALVKAVSSWVHFVHFRSTPNKLCSRHTCCFSDNRMRDFGQVTQLNQRFELRHMVRRMTMTCFLHRSLWAKTIHCRPVENRLLWQKMSFQMISKKGMKLIPFAVRRLLQRRPELQGVSFG